MASIRGGYGLPARPSDGYKGPMRSRIPSSRSVPKHLDPAEPTDPSPPQPISLATPNPRPLGRVGSVSSSSHHHSIPAFSNRPRHAPQNTGVDGLPSVTTRSSLLHTQNGSGSSTSSRSYDGNSRSGHSNFSRKRSSTAESSASSSQPRIPKPSSSLPGPSSERRRSRPSLDSASVAQFDRAITASPANVSSAKSAQPTTVSIKSTSTPVIYPELDRYRNIQSATSSKESIDSLFKLSAHDLPPPTPNALFSGSSSSQVSASPSTKFSGSPGPFAISRDTTPTSISSQSPGIVAPKRFAASLKARQASPTRSRPPVTRRRTGSLTNEPESAVRDPRGLAAVRESTTSSSSNSTVREADRGTRKLQTSGVAVPPPLPSPPPRKSSQNFRGKNERRPSAAPAAALAAIHTMEAPVSPPKASPTRSGPPSRPSREGTPNLNSDFFDPTPVIHTAIVARAVGTERRGSESTAPRIVQSSITSPGLGPKSASTSHLPGLVNTSAVLKSHPPVSKRPIQQRSSEKGRPASPSPAPSFNSRFHFFGRKRLNPEETASKAESKKLLRKGPAAGTGYEGYGRLGSVRRRSGGLTLGRSHQESSISQESVASQDSFLTDRMNPVVISGGGVVDNRNRNSELAKLSSSRPSLDSQETSSSIDVFKPESSGLQPSAMPRRRQQSTQLRRPSDSSESEEPLVKPSLALRRSLHRFNNGKEETLNTFNLPQPISVGKMASPAINSLDTSIMSDESHVELQKEMSKSSVTSDLMPRKLQKRSRSPRKWNLFSRSHQPSPERVTKPVSAQVTVVEKRPVPFYAMMDFPERYSDNMDVQSALQDAEVLPPNAVASNFSANTSQKSASNTSLPIPAPTNLLPSGRPSRLPQVGRIPIAGSQRMDRPTTKSFSRPFRASLPVSPKTMQFADPQFIAKGPTPPKSPTLVPDLTMEDSTVESGTMNISTRASPGKSSVDYTHMGTEFLSFSPRKSSEDTVATSSSSSASVLFAASTAVIPTPLDPPAEDEIWDEYDDFLADDTLKPRQSTTSSKGIPFPLEKYNDRLVKEVKAESPTIVASKNRLSVRSVAETRSSCCSSDMTDRLKNAFQIRPTSENQAMPAVNEAAKPDEDSAQPKPQRLSTTSSCQSRLSNCSSVLSDYGSPLAQVNLRVGSMTVSKWLTFGHVMFSDLRHQMPHKDEVPAARLAVLVIDGLGNDDWSFYAAETYQSIDFYNLSPKAPVSPELSKSSAFPSSPKNHHQIQYTSNFDKFPFAARRFDAVVYRFPIAAPETHYRNIVTEARRVLKPGGFIELAILDVDLNNMGNCGRRAIRQLKERLHIAEPKTHMGSAADMIVRYLGNGGFTGIKAARVGVPVASSIAKSSDTRRSSSVPKTTKEPPSLSEMMRDPSPDADAGITKMVARVGRWWYSKCYENTASPSPPRSIWDDKALLRECEDFGTSLKLMVCCARAPEPGSMR